MKTLFKSLSILALLISLTISVKAHPSPDTPNRPRYYWFTGGLGIGTQRSIVVIGALNAEVTHNMILTADAGFHTNDFPFKEGTRLAIASYNLMAGRMFTTSRLLFNVSAGIGYSRGYIAYYSWSNLSASTLSSKKTKGSVNFPIAFQGYFTPLRFLGIGLGGFINLNSIKTTGGVTLSYALGRVGLRHVKKQNLLKR